MFSQHLAVGRGASAWLISLQGRYERQFPVVTHATPEAEISFELKYFMYANWYSQYGIRTQDCYRSNPVCKLYATAFSCIKHITIKYLCPPTYILAKRDRPNTLNLQNLRKNKRAWGEECTMIYFLWITLQRKSDEGTTAALNNFFRSNFGGKQS